MAAILVLVWLILALALARTGHLVPFEGSWVTSTMARGGGLWLSGRMTVYTIMLFLSIVLPAAGAQYAKSPRARDQQRAFCR